MSPSKQQTPPEHKKDTLLQFVLVGLQVIIKSNLVYSLLDQSGRQGVTTSFKLNKFWSLLLSTLLGLYVGR